MANRSKSHSKLFVRVREIQFLALRYFAIALFFIYICWNIYWWAHGSLAPSLIQAFVDLPGPTTGFTRALLALGRGSYIESLKYHPLAVPIALLTVGCVTTLAYQAIQRRRLYLSQWVAVTWMVLIIVGWIYKLFSDPLYW